MDVWFVAAILVGLLIFDIEVIRYMRREDSAPSA
jgi:hypothetical protein